MNNSLCSQNYTMTLFRWHFCFLNLDIVFHEKKIIHWKLYVWKFSVVLCYVRIYSNINKRKKNRFYWLNFCSRLSSSNKNITWPTKIYFPIQYRHIVIAMAVNGHFSLFIERSECLVYREKSILAFSNVYIYSLLLESERERKFWNSADSWLICSLLSLCK